MEKWSDGASVHLVYQIILLTGYQLVFRILMHSRYFLRQLKCIVTLDIDLIDTLVHMMYCCYWPPA